MKTRLRRDTHADESLFGPFVFFAVFIAVSGFIIGSMSALFTYSSIGEFNYLSGSAIILGNQTYTYIDGTTPGYNVTWTNVTDRWLYLDTDPKFTFHDDTNDDDVTVGFIRNQTVYAPWGENFVGIYEKWGWWSDEFDRIQYSTIEDMQIPYTNTSVVDFEIHDKAYSFVFITPSDYVNHSYHIAQSNFFAAIAFTPYDEDNIASTSMWTLIGQMLTARLPTVHPAIQYLIAVPMWVGVGFIVFTLVSRMIPFISGG